MKIYLSLLLLVIPCFSMKQEENLTKPRSDSLIISIEAHPIANEVVHKALNGQTDDYVIHLIGNAIDKNRKAYYYPNLNKQRELFLSGSPKSRSRDDLTRYVISELIEDREHQRYEKKRERKMKYAAAIIGGSVSIITAAIGAVSAYFASR